MARLRPSLRVRDALAAVGRLSAEHRRPVFALALIAVLVAGGVAATALQMQMGMTLYVDDDAPASTDWRTLKSDHRTGNNVFVVVESDSLTDPETVRALSRLDARYTRTGRFSAVTSLADAVRLGAGGQIPNTRAGVERALARVRERPGGDALVSRLRPAPGTTVVRASYGDVDRFDRGRFLPTRGADVVYRDVREETAATELPPGTEVTITGQPVFENAAFGLMLPEMIGLFAGAFGLIFGIVFLVMRGRLARGRAVALPVGTALAALVLMTGAMGVLGYSFNAIMLGVMPIALGLGIDYGLQIQTRYIEARERGEPPATAAETASRTTGRALLIAMATTVVGLGSLLVSPVPPVRQFGVTSAISVLSAMALSVTLLPALLVRFDGEVVGAAGQEGAVDEDGADRLGAVMRDTTERLTTARPLVTLAIAALLVGAGAYAYPQVEPRQEMMDFWPQGLDEKEDLDRLTDTVESPKVVYVLVETDRAYTPETFRQVRHYQALMLENDRVNGVSSPVRAVSRTTDGRMPRTEHELDAALEAASSSAPMVIEDPDRHPSRLLLTFYVDDIEGEPVRTLIDEFEGTAAHTVDNAAEVRVTGKPVLNRTVIENVTAGLTPMTLLSFALGGAVLALAFRSPRIAAVLVGTVAATAALLVTGLMYLLSLPWNPLTIAMSSIALGVGVDYGVHVFERFEYEIERGATDRAAAGTAVARLARPVFGSSLTTVFGFGVLSVSRFPVLANFGWVTVFAIALSLVGAFFVLPAALVAVPGLVERPADA